jgi:oligopeptide/dipeptide ABC transporter ATP-binding protein
MTQPLLRIRDVRTWYPIRRGILARTLGHVKAVDGVSFDLERGETVALVGESGCGKTTLGRTILGLERRREGEILLDGVPLWPARHRDCVPLRRRVQMIFQDPHASLNPRMTIQDIVSEGALAHGLIRPRDRGETARRLLAEVGVDEAALNRYPHEFSGGQRQRISMARALAVRPDLIVCDEAVSALDVSVRAQVLNLLIALREARGLAYLFISHDLAVARHIAHRVVVMYLGVAVETGTAAEVLDAPVHPYTRALSSAVPVPFAERRRAEALRGEVPSPARPPSGCRFRTRCPLALPACAEARPALDPFGSATHHVACIRKSELVQKKNS